MTHHHISPGDRVRFAAICGRVLRIANDCGQRIAVVVGDSGEQVSVAVEALEVEEE